MSCKERAPGISFLASIPSGRPQPMEFEKGWYNNFSIFIDYWQHFASYQMPQSESVDTYVSKHDIESPLGQYLYGSVSFASDEQFSAATATIESSSTTGFCNEHHSRASAFDLDRMDYIAQKITDLSVERSSRSIQKLGIHQAVHTSKNFASQRIRGEQALSKGHMRRMV